MQLNLDKLRARGATAQTAAGEEAVHLTAKSNAVLRHLPRAERLETLRGWEDSLKGTVEANGGTIVPDSLSLLGQYVQILLPVRSVDKVVAELNQRDIRVDTVERKLSMPSG